MKVIEFKTKQKEYEHEYEKLIKEALTHWLQYTDIKDLVLVGVVKGGGFRYYVPEHYIYMDNIYLMGVMDYMKGFFGIEQN